MLRRTLLCLALFATGEAAKAKADPKECEVCIANLEAIDKLIDKDEKTSKPVRKSNSVSGAPDNSSLSHFSAMTRPSWLGRAARNRHCHAIDQASRTRRKI